MSYRYRLGQKGLQSGIAIFHLVCSFLHKYLLNAYYMTDIMHPRKTPRLVLSIHKCKLTACSRRAAKTFMFSLHPGWNSERSPEEVLRYITGLRILIFSLFTLYIWNFIREKVVWGLFVCFFKHRTMKNASSDEPNFISINMALLAIKLVHSPQTTSDRPTSSPIATLLMTLSPDLTAPQSSGPSYLAVYQPSPLGPCLNSYVNLILSPHLFLLSDSLQSQCLMPPASQPHVSHVPSLCLIPVSHRAIFTSL